MSVRSREDAQALLAAATRLLSGRHEPVRLRVAWHGVDYDVRFDMPGVVNVLPMRGSVPVASSEPGDPSTLATWREEP